MRILITGGGGAAAISVWKSLKDEHNLYMADIDPSACGLYLVPNQQRFLIPRGDSPEFVPTLLSLCKKHGIEVLVPTVDSELAPLAKASDTFLTAGIKVPISPYEALKRCYDKHALLTHYRAEAKNPTAIPTFILLNKESMASITEFPRFAKPRIGAGSNGIKVIHSQKDLAGLPIDNSYLIQELLPGDEYSVDVYIDSQGQAIAAVPRLRIKVDSGVAVTARTCQFPELANTAIEIAKIIGIRYVANIQFKASKEGQFKLLEINPRFSGALPLTTAAGVDMPKLLLKDIQGEALPKGLMPFNDLMVVRYWTEHFFPPSEWEALCQH